MTIEAGFSITRSPVQREAIPPPAVVKRTNAGFQSAAPIEQSECGNLREDRRSTAAQRRLSRR
ncbi:hypothetical protein AM571_PB00366 (plasmid) [Rhizobium etli 8C-3]|uniref:Uncharacterized protein n=1 Tax=Rhizobium etli 8C-3 TaxID=538025 RepID=A0A1L5PBN5_RHIET|nr:hypothetical protein AM571_PB00366 [Rhizobium etli 8C-3]PDT06793.1 hypothetical protein CO655_30700 [Rhizobium sp. M1]